MKIKNIGEGFRGENGHIGYLLRQASHIVRLKINRALKKQKITHPQFAVMTVLELESGLHAADVARISMLSPQAVNRIIMTLETAGLIERVAHEIHGRVIKIFLTLLGKKQLEQCKKIVANIELELINSLAPKDIKLIKKWLVKCAMK